MSNGYSEKVMEYFQNPKNMGEIKDADGIGKVGNPVCLYPATTVHANDRLKKIYKLDREEKVLTHNGEYYPIRRRVKRDFKGKLNLIKNKLGVIRVTPEHEILSIKIPQTHHFHFLKNKKKKKKAWYHSEELETGDIMLYPIPKETKDCHEIEINIKKSKYDSRSREIPRKVKIDSDFLRLAGYYLSEGSVREAKCKAYLSFTFNIEEEEYVNDTKDIIKRLFGVPVKIDNRRERHTTHVLVYNAYLARFFKRLFNIGAENKRIPRFMMLLPPHKQKELIKGLWGGDGFVNLKHPRAGFSTISYELCHQLKLLLIRQRIIPSIYTENETIKANTYHRKAYRIHIGNRNSVLKLFNILGVDYKTDKKTKSGSWIDEDFIYVPITKVQEINYNGPVCNLEIDKAMSYVTESATVHNCGDLMWVYITVGRNQKGQEVIKDIKVKTFGCVAAIASSSVTTEMAKGKTLDDAKKISKDQVSKQLGGLPPIKKHCSVLAVDGLRSAIKDYREKKPTR